MSVASPPVPSAGGQPAEPVLLPQRAIDVHAHPRLGDDALLERYIGLMDFYHVERTVLLGDVLARGYDPRPEEVRAINDQTMRAVTSYPERFVGFCFLNPHHDETVVRREMRRCLVEGPLQGVKLEVAVNARSGRLNPIMQELQRLRLPLLHHAWYKATGRAFNESTPRDIADLAGRFPRVTIIMAHVIAAGMRGIEDVAPHANLMVDTSGSQPESGVIEKAVRRLGARRVLFGTDVPGRDYSAQLAKVLAAAVTARQREMILYDNARRLLGTRGTTGGRT